MSLRLSNPARDYDSIVADITRQYLRELPESNDFLRGNVGHFFTSVVAGATDQLHLYLDRFSSEAFIDRCETRGGAISILRLVGFQPQNPHPELVDVVFTTTDLPNTDVPIPQYTRLKSSGGLDWVTAIPATLPAGFLSTSVPCMQGIWRSTSFTSNGGPVQRVLLLSFKIADGKVRVLVDNVEWSNAPSNSFVKSKSTDAYFRYVHTEDRRVIIEFGDGLEGAIPVRGAQVEIQYFETLHTAGRVAHNKITNLVSAVPGADFAVTNPTGSAGGQDFETLASMRLRYPAAVKANDRALTLEDWEALARLVPGVMQATAIDVNTDTSLPYWFVNLYVIGNGGVISKALNDSVREEMRRKRVSAQSFDVKSPEQVLVDVDIGLYVLRSHSAVNVQASVTQAIEDFFTMTPDDESEIKLGEKVFLSRLTARIQSISGVDSMVYNSPTNDINVGYFQFARLNTLKVAIKGLV